MKKLYYYWIQWSYSHQAACEAKIQFWLPDYNWIWEPLARVLREKLSDDSNALAIVPIENSTAWTVHVHQFRFLEYDMSVLWELFLPIRHCLLAHHTDVSQLDEVISHPQALEQCYGYLSSHWITAVEYTDTASAAQEITQTGTMKRWAIASSLAAELYDLKVVQNGIQDRRDNVTRFLLIGKNQKFVSKDWSKSILLLRTSHDAWSLYAALWVLNDAWIILTKLESIPRRDDPFSYEFWIECDAGYWSIMFEKTLEKLHSCCQSVRVLWSF